MKRGECGLCQKEKYLALSHLMPKSLYRKIRNGYSGTDIVVSQASDKSSFYSNRQETQYFLCEDCEILFSRLGENKVVPDCHGGEKQFPLLDWVNSAVHFAQRDGSLWISPIQNKFDRTDEYLYFAASIYWRGSAWPISKCGNQGSLGAYQEEFRKYLLGEATFPKNAFVTVYVDTDDPIYPLMSFPTSAKKGGYHHHIFNIPGVKFSMVVGKTVKGVREVSTALGSKLIFATYSYTKHKDFKYYNRKISQEFTSKGRLAKQKNV